MLPLKYTHRHPFKYTKMLRLIRNLVKMEKHTNQSNDLTFFEVSQVNKKGEKNKSLGMTRRHKFTHTGPTESERTKRQTCALALVRNPAHKLYLK